MENKLNIEDLTYKAGNWKKIKHDLQIFETLRSFGIQIYKNDLSIDGALEHKIGLKDDIDIFEKLTKPKESLQKKNITNSSK